MPIKEENYYKDHAFDKDSISILHFSGSQFEHCTFRGCDFSAVNIRNSDFTNCIFTSCNFSMVKFVAVGLDHVQFDDCKLVGTDFSTVKEFLFNANFKNSRLDYSTFMRRKNRKASFQGCSLIGTDFSEADLSGSSFDRCDLSAAVFMRSNLTSTNFTSSFNFTIDPDKNQIRQARFSPQGLSGLLTKYGVVVE